MTEAEWLRCTDAKQMLEWLGARVSERKLRLFSVACCRLFPYWKDERFHQALEASEHYADGQGTKAALKRGRQGVRAARFALAANDPAVHGEWSVYWLAEVAASENAASRVLDEVARLAGQGILDLPPHTHSSICILVRDLVGNPFQSVSFIRAWRGPAPSALAHAIYQTRDFSQRPRLADALEQAGCEDPEVLSHCRGPGPHARGCWVVDGVLGAG